MKMKRLLGIVALAIASVGILAACGKDAAKDKTVWYEWEPWLRVSLSKHAGIRLKKF